MSCNDLYRLISACIYYKKQIGKERLAKLIELFLVSEPQTSHGASPDVVESYRKQISALIGRLHKLRAPIDSEVYEKLRAIGEQSKKE